MPVVTGEVAEFVRQVEEMAAKEDPEINKEFHTLHINRQETFVMLQHMFTRDRTFRLFICACTELYGEAYRDKQVGTLIKLFQELINILEASCIIPKT